MSDPFIVALFALGISVIASAIRMIDWFLHSDPKTVARAARWASVAIAALSIPLLIVLLFKEQWTAATALAAAMILMAALLGRRLLRWIDLRPLVPDRSAPATGGRAGLGEGMLDDPELVRRSAAVLEAYLRRTSDRAGGPDMLLPSPHGKTHGSARASGNGHANGKGLANGDGNGHAMMSGVGAMSEAEALAILGLERGATAHEIDEAYRRIALRIDPDGGGSRYLAVKVNEAKEVLLPGAGDPSTGVAPDVARKRKSSRRRPRQQPDA